MTVNIREYRLKIISAQQKSYILLILAFVCFFGTAFVESQYAVILIVVACLFAAIAIKSLEPALISE